MNNTNEQKKKKSVGDKEKK